MRSERITFQGAHGDQLAARLDRPLDGRPEAWALFAHCFTCSKDLKAAKNVSRALTARRIAVLRFDFTGLGESEGDFADTDFSSNVADLVAAAEYLEEHHAGPRILVGHSLGGAAALQAAHEISSVRAVATIGAPAEPTHVTGLLEGSIEEIEEEGEARVTIAGRSFTIRKGFLDSLEAGSMEETIGGLDRPLLIFHSPVDRIVGVDNAARIYRAARHPKSFISLDDADHLLTDEADSLYVGAVLAAWVSRYLERSTLDSVEAVRAEAQATVRTGGSGFRTDVLAGRHGLVSDEPEAVGGTDQGPSPYDLLVASLGACTSMTLRMYADRKEWPLEEIVVRLDHAKVHAEDCEDCPDTEAARIDRIERTIELVGDLDEEQRARLLEIANRCPVHRTLTSDIVIASSLWDGAGASGAGNQTSHHS